MEEDYAEAAAYFDARDNRIIVTADSSYSVGADEIELDPKQYGDAVSVHYGSPLHIAVRRYLIGAVLRAVPEIRKGPANASKKANANSSDGSELLNFIQKRWLLDQAPKIMSEVWTLGLACVRLQRDPDTDWPIPHVHRFALGSRYKVTIREKLRSRVQQYRFYRIERRPGRTGTVQRDTKTVIYDGFDTDPFPETGKLNSVVVSLLDKERDHEEAYRVARVAQMNRARPMVLLETSRTTDGMSEPSAPPLPFLGGQDFLPEDRRQKIADAALSNDVLSRQQAAFWNQYFDRIEELAASGEKSVHQAHNNIIPLPPDSRSASYQLAAMREDWSELIGIYEDRVTSTYGLQRSHIHSSMGRLQVSEMLANASLVNVINRWRVDLSRVFTDLYQRAFDTDGEIVFPAEVNDTPEGLYEKWQQGLLTWEGYKTLAHALTGIDERYMEKKAPPREPLATTAGAGGAAGGSAGGAAKKKKKPAAAAASAGGKRKRAQNGSV